MPSTHPKPTYPTIITNPISPPPRSETEIYSVAKVAYTKLVSEASLKNQNLRRLVGHANLYDKLLDEYNNTCVSDEGEDGEAVSDDDDTDSWDSDEELEELEEIARQGCFVARGGVSVSLSGDGNVKTGGEASAESCGIDGGKKDAVRIYEESRYLYETREQERGRQLGQSEGVIEEIGLCKVASNPNFHSLGEYEIEVKELEDFDE